MVNDVAGTLRRLRFDLKLHDDESVPGAIARGVAGHHLVKLGFVLKETGSRRYAGLTQLAEPATLARVAHVVRCDADHLMAQSGRRLVEPGDRRLQHFVDFNGLVLPRGHLELRRRRISPLALLDFPYHRQAWLMALLPFCPETLERLIDTCPHCDFKLGWVQSAGIERCEDCLRIVPPSTLPALPIDLSENYRLFAGLLSLKPNERAGSVAAMPPRLQRLTPGEIARLAIRCGLDCGDGLEKRVWQTRAARLAPERTAETVDRGIALLRSWPHGISAWAEDQLARAPDEGMCRRDLGRRIRRIAWGDSGFSDQRALLGEVFPDLKSPSAPSASSVGSTYTGNEANRLVPGFRDHAAEIRRLKIVPYRLASASGSAVKYLYSAPPIEAAAKRSKDSKFISSIMDQLQLPLYAIEQFFDAELLSRQDDPILSIILKRPLAIASTFDDFVRRLKASRSRRTRPAGALPIGHESHRIGGRAKPWSDIYEALLTKRIAYWLVGGSGTDRLLVERGSLDEFIATDSRPVATAARDMPTMDAAELLNVIPASVRALRNAEVLAHIKGPRALTTPRADIEALAANYVSAAEMARRARTTAEHVNDQLRSLGFKSFHGLWNRSEVLDVLPLR
jgi:hypothetical protein